ncbi:MAG: hypothetical protein N3F66_12025 [Spirochaetes bacterium]|nr:hypothetical protein [Spirochaetota bacterium]
MERIAKSIVPNYNLHKIMGFSESMPIPNKDAAAQILHDFSESKLFFKLVHALMEAQENGIMGRRYPIAHLHEIIAEIINLGFVYDKNNRIFIENAKTRKTPNWGVLEEDEEYIVTLLRLDIAANSKLVRKYESQLITQTYQGLRHIVTAAVEQRNGRIWNWEGDGCIAAFILGNRNMSAVCAAIEIFHELFLFNVIESQLPEPVNIRVAIDTGYCTYKHIPEELKKTELVKKIMEIESSFTPLNSINITNPVYSSLHAQIAEKFTTKKIGATLHYIYSIQWNSK